MARHYHLINGVLLFDKPLELSSNTALQKVRHLFQAKKAGHTGTLDPLATGLLPICFGGATKFSNCLLDADKAYIATVQLGVTTTTGDAEGGIVLSRPVVTNQDQIEHTLKQFIGDIKQVPPMHSALKFNGKPLYEYIRSGQEIERAPRQVFISQLELIDFSGDKFSFHVRCSKGTYVRTLAEDVGEVLGCGGHLIGLRRTAIGHFELKDAISWDELQQLTPEQYMGRMMPIDCLMPELPSLQLDAVQVRRIGQGQRLSIENPPSQGKVKLVGDDGFIGVGELEGHRLSVSRILAEVAKQASNNEN